MKKWMVFLSLFCFSVYAQEKEEEKDWEIFPGLDVYYTSFINTGNTMTQDAHRKYASGFGFQLGVMEYKKMNVALFYEYARNIINDMTMIANFDHTRYNEYGLVFNYQISLTEKTRIQPGIGYYSTKARNLGDQRRAIYRGNGFLIGTEYLIFLSDRIALIIGVHYNYVRFNMDANPVYKDYFANAHRIQFKLGFHLGK